MKVDEDDIAPRPDNIAQFRRPELDEEILTAMEQLELSEKAREFLTGQHQRIRQVRQALKAPVSAAALGMLADDLEALESEIEYAGAMVGHWQEILEALKKRTARL